MYRLLPSKACCWSNDASGTLLDSAACNAIKLVGSCSTTSPKGASQMAQQGLMDVVAHALHKVWPHCNNSGLCMPSSKVALQDSQQCSCKCDVIALWQLRCYQCCTTRHSMNLAAASRAFLLFMGALARSWPLGQPSSGFCPEEPRFVYIGYGGVPATQWLGRTAVG